MVLLFLSLALGVARGAQSAEVAAMLERQTQELLDAVSAGKAEVWERYLDPEARYVDESGRVLRRKELVEEIKPLPAGVSGVLKVTGFEASVQGDVAVATYVADENEDYHGHKIHCQYRTTDTWKKTAEGWRLIASQTLAIRSDPPSIALSAARRQEYCGR